MGEVNVKELKKVFKNIHPDELDEIVLKHLEGMPNPTLKDYEKYADKFMALRAMALDAQSLRGIARKMASASGGISQAVKDLST